MALRVKLSGGAAAFVLLLATASLLAAPAHGMQYKCSACKAVGRELYRRLSEEDLSDKKDLDLRYGLDPHGKRKGRMLPYKESELRATELLDVRGRVRAERDRPVPSSPVQTFFFFSFFFPVVFLQTEKRQATVHHLRKAGENKTDRPW